MTTRYFPRGYVQPLTAHEPIATTHWTPSDTLGDYFGVTGEERNPFLFGKQITDSGEGGYLVFDDDAHIITTAGSRAGKGVSLIFPNLLSYSGSVINVDPKGENAIVTAQWRREELGQAVFIFDPFGETGEDTASLNPLMALDPNDPEFIDDINDLAESFIVRDGEKDPYWNDGARAMIKMILIYIVYEHHPDDRHLIWLRRLLLTGEAHPQKPNKPPSFLRLLKNIKKHPHPIVSGTATRFLDMSEKERGTMLSTAHNHTEFLDSPSIAKTLDKQTMDLSTLRTGATVYLVLPERRLASHNRWLRLFITLFMRHLQVDRKRHQDDPSVLFLLDEYASIGYMKVIERAMGYIAGFGVRLWIVIQDLSQLKDIHPKRWETFIGNAGIFTAFGNTDLATLEYISRRLGKCEVPREELNHSIAQGESENLPSLAQVKDNPLALMGAGEGKSSNASTSIRPSFVLSPLLLPEEVARYFGKSTGKILVLFGQGQPVYVDRIVYYEDAPFSSRAMENTFYTGKS